MRKLKFLVIFSLVFFGVLGFVKSSWAAETICSRGDILYCEDWESYTVGVCSPPFGSDDCAADGGGIVSSPQHTPGGNKAADLQLTKNNFDGSGTPCVHRQSYFTSQQTPVYVRWYVYWSPGFIWNSVTNKNMYIGNFDTVNESFRTGFRFHLERADGEGGSDTTHGRFMVQLYCGTGTQNDLTNADCVAMGRDDGEARYYQNLNLPQINIESGRWYSVEVKYTPDQQGVKSSGRVEAWLDGVKIMDHNGISTRPNAITSARPTNGIWVTSYYGGGGGAAPQTQHVYYDDIVVSKSYIGPSGGSDTQNPSIPTNLSATVVSSSQINLSWTASTDNVGVTGYRIYRCQGTGCTPTTQIATSATNSYSDTGLSPSTTYIYTVAAYDAAGNVSNQCPQVSATTQAGDTTAPVISNGSPTGTLPAGTTQTTMSVTTNENATCRWSSTAGTAYSSMTNTFSTTGGTSHSTTLTGLTNGTTYNRYVRCQDTAGNANTSDYTITFSVASAANELHVGSGQTYSTIMAAMNAAVAGNKIIVHAGTYNEMVDFNIKHGQDLCRYLRPLPCPSTIEGIYRIDLYGTIFFSSDGDGVRVEV